MTRTICSRVLDREDEKAKAEKDEGKRRTRVQARQIGESSSRDPRDSSRLFKSTRGGGERESVGV